MTAILAVDALSVRYETPDGVVNAVNDVSLEIAAGECIGVVGESGAGKSQAFLAVMGLLAPNAKVSGGAKLRGRELLGTDPRALRELRGAELAMIFQDPMTSLAPHIKVGDQIAETLVVHKRTSWRDARAQALKLLEQVQVTDAARRLTQYPHELSGGMRQRVMIAIALACDPVMLIADEPTTALDVSVQAQILSLLKRLMRERGMALALITHDLGVVAGLADHVTVLYAGRVVEAGTVRRLLKQPAHPYTAALLRSMPRIDASVSEPLVAIRGQPPSPRELVGGCPFHPRCDLAQPRCAEERPTLRSTAGAMVACHFPIAASHGDLS
ncbi:MAG: ABC transporter ATP-binding protein [Pseudomonadales bacterium]|nr:ABC transporter ATP-binding protein [Pseudomonadales bacterium]